MALVKTHIVLDDDAVDAPEKRLEVLAEIRRKADISDVNEQRFALYGMLTCNVDEAFLDAIREIPGVAGVEVDQVRTLSSV